jgi:zinc transporter ZupT
MIWLIIGASAAATFVGGLFALRLRDKLHLALGFSAGAIIALALFELIPEALEAASGSYDAHYVLGFVALGFFAYTALDRLAALHAHTDADHCHAHGRNGLGIVGAGSLSAHSVLDGFAIGIAFLTSPELGVVVAAAIVAHDFSDGINTVNLVLRSGGSRAEAIRWLLIDAIAPVIGVMLALLIAIPDIFRSLVLAIFAGLFLYIGASDLLPESHHQHPKLLTTLLTLAGAAFMFVTIMLSH